MALDNMRGDLVKQTALHPIDPVKDYQGECRARTIRSDRADADGSRLDDVLTSTALQDSANYLQFPDCNGDSKKVLPTIANRPFSSSPWTLHHLVDACLLSISVADRSAFACVAMPRLSKSLNNRKPFCTGWYETTSC